MFNVRELESDNLNPQDMCVETNKLTTPELALFFVLFSMFLLNARWIEVGMMVPLLLRNVYLIARNKNKLDVLSVFEILPRYKVENYVRFVFFICLFFVTLFRFVSLVVTNADRFVDDDW